MQTRKFIRNLKDFSKSLRYIAGYKNVVFFSRGIPSSFFYDKYDSSIRDSYKDMSQELSSSNVSFYTVNSYSKAKRLLTKGNVLDETDSLKMLSDITGGSYFEDVERYKTISKKIDEITGNYYVLGYYVDEKWDGKYHRIKVKVKQKGCVVHSQAGYYDPKPFSEFSEFEKKLHLIDVALKKNPYFGEPLSFSSLPLPCSHPEKSNLALLSRIPVEKMEEEWEGKVEIVSFILDERNNVVDLRKGEVSVSEVPPKNTYHYTVFSIPPGDYKSRVVIRNLKTGKAAVAGSSLDIEKPPQKGIKLYPPLFLIPQKEPFYLKTSPSPKEKGLTLMDIYPYLSDGFSPLVKNLDRGTSKIRAVLRSSVKGIKPDVRLSVYLKDLSTNKKTSLPFSLLQGRKKEGMDILLIEIEFPKLQPGKYSLEIAAEETVSGFKSKTEHTFEII